jgi:VanZ family protein
VIGPVLRFFFPNASPETIREYHGLIRKIAHVCLYAGLGVLTVRSYAVRKVAPQLPTVVTAILFVLFIASLDELHQSFLKSRTGTPWDVLLDLVGGLLGIGAGIKIYGLSRARLPYPPVEPTPE